MDIKLVIGLKDGKSVQKVVKTDDAKRLVGLKIGESFKGESMNLSGYEFMITGGSDIAGFPMRRDVLGTGRKKIWSTKGVGIKDIVGKGTRIRKNVGGNTISTNTVQVNVKILKEGKSPLEADKTEKKE